MSLGIETKVAGAAGTKGKLTTDEANLIVSVLNNAMGDLTGENGLKEAIESSDVPYLRLDKDGTPGNNTYNAKDLKSYTEDNNSTATVRELKGTMFLNITAFNNLPTTDPDFGKVTINKIVIPGATNKTLTSQTTYTLIDGMNNVIYADFTNNTFKLITDVSDKILNPKLGSLTIDGFSITKVNDTLGKPYVKLATTGNNGFIITDQVLKVGGKDITPGTYLLTNDVISERIITGSDIPMLGDTSVTASGMKSFIIPVDTVDNNGKSVTAGEAREITINDLSLIYTDKFIYIKGEDGTYTYTGDALALDYLYKDNDFEMTCTTFVNQGYSANLNFVGTSMLLDGVPYTSGASISAGTHTFRGIGITKIDTNYDSWTSIHIEKASKVTNIDYAFDTLWSLTSFTAKPDTFGACTSMQHAWRNCTGLTTFPTIDTSKVTNIEYAWFGCNNLTSFPLLDFSSVVGTGFNYAWFMNRKLTSFPLINTAGATELLSTWGACDALETFPLIDTSNVTVLGRGDNTYVLGLLNSVGNTFDKYEKETLYLNVGTWADCHSLLEFPAIDTSNVTKLHDTWKNCHGMKRFPAIDISKVVNITAPWGRCTSLECMGGFTNNGVAPTTQLSVFDASTSLQHPNATEQASILAGNTWTNAAGCGGVDMTPNDFILDLYVKPTNTATGYGSVEINLGKYTGSIKVDGVPYTSGRLSDGFHAITGIGVTKFAFESTVGSKSYLSEISLSSINMYKNSKQEDASGMFYNAAPLTSFTAKPDMFGACTNMNQTWDRCSSLTSFPLIDTSKVTIMYEAWINCSSLTSFPLIDVSKVTSIMRAWEGCTSLVCMGGFKRPNNQAYPYKDFAFYNTPALLHPNSTEQASIKAGNQWINPNAC